MRISIFGLGYVGCVTAARLAEAGHDVLGVDVNQDKVRMINRGASPIVEPGLGELLGKVTRENRLFATADVGEAVAASDLALVCVGTPSNGNGSLDLRYLERVVWQIGLALARKPRNFTLVVRSTMLPGSVESTVLPALQMTLSDEALSHIDIAVNPEFIREGSALSDFIAPPFTLVGSESAAAADLLREVYAGIGAPFIQTDIRTAEMVKYVCNTFHALKICFANEVAELCDAFGADSAETLRVFRMDGRLNISAAYLHPGFAFGGSCLPKDVRALTHAAGRADVPVPLLASIMSSNDFQVQRAIDRVCAARKRRVGVVGLAFKPGTDDLRESPLVRLVEALIGKGLSVRVLDPNVSLARLVGANRRYIENEIPHIASVLCESVDDLLDHAELIVVGNGGSEAAQVVAARRPGIDVIDLSRSVTIGHARPVSATAQASALEAGWQPFQ